LLSQAVRKVLSNQRKSGAKAKTRSEVTGSGIKIWKQKGTGRARHGDRQAPIFVGGGKAHGPTGTQNYHLDLPKKMRQKAVLGALSAKLEEKKAFLLGDLQIAKTKEAFTFVEKVREKFALKGKILFICSRGEEGKRYFRNLRGITVLNSQMLNTYQLLASEAILLTGEALKEIIHQEK